MALLVLSDDEIRSKLAEYGHPVGPITETTRKILLKKLGQLIKQKKPSRRSTFGFSSAEESETEEHGGVGRNRRVPMPPPTTFLSRRKSNAPKTNSHNSSFNSDFIAPSISRAPSRRRESTRNHSRLSAYDFDSGSDSDFSPISSTKIISGRSSLTPPSRPSFSSSPTSNSRKETRPFLSNITRRLARWSNELNPQDIKETDIDDSPVCATTPSFVYRGTPSVARTLYERQPVLEGGWRSQLTQWGPMLLLSLFLMFFVWLAGTYLFLAYQQRPLLTGKKDNVYPLCTDRNNERCIPMDELHLAVLLYRNVHQVLLSRAVQAKCGPVLEDGSVIRPYMTEREIVQYLIKALPEHVGRIESGVQNLGLLTMANPHWGITLLRGDDVIPTADTCNIPDASKAVPSDLDENVPILFITLCPELSWGCRLRLFFVGLVYYIGGGITAVCLIYLAVIGARYYARTMKEGEEQVMQLVEKILTEVTESCARNQTEYVAIRHVHDTLIPPADRPSMAEVWKKAVDFIEKHESRVRREIQTVWGEETAVWRPLTQTISNPPSPSVENHLYPDLSTLAHREGQRVWQGEAFEVSDGSINALPVSPTPCLKIRHMFQPNKDYGADWETCVKDAIIERCDGAGIVHVVVDAQSKEGCVFLKCLSSADAGTAFRRLHGSWFDGDLVTVKYLRLERYHERFPDSINCKTPLKPSNNLRLSMGGRA